MAVSDTVAAADLSGSKINEGQTYWLALLVSPMRTLAVYLVTQTADRYKALEMLDHLGPQHEARCVVIAGEPPSKARPRFTKTGRPYTPKRTIEGEKRLAAAFTGLPRFLGNVAIVAIFRRSSRQRIDVDNMLKAVLDAGTRANLWHDDSQVTALLGFVEYDAVNPRTVVAFGRHESTLTRGEDAMVKCEACGQLFMPGGHQRREHARWCSRECRTVLAEPVPCPSCGQLFKRRSGNQKFCSVACRGLSRSKSFAQRTHCRKGHEMTPENTYVLADGRRRCRACQARAARDMRQRREPVFACSVDESAGLIETEGA